MQVCFLTIAKSSIVWSKKTPMSTHSVSTRVMVCGYQEPLKKSCRFCLPRYLNSWRSSKVFHIQFILKDTKIFLIEMMLRCPGDLYGRLVELSTNFDYFGNYIKAYIDSYRLSENVPKATCKIKRVTFKVKPGQRIPKIIRTSEFIESYQTQPLNEKNSTTKNIRYGVAFLKNQFSVTIKET